MERLTEEYMGCNEIKKCNHLTCEETCNTVSGCAHCPIQEAIKKLAEYEQAEEDGVLIRLPFRIGQKVYYIYTSCIDGSLMIGGMVYGYSCLDFPRTYYATKEEAEQALAKMKGE